MRARPRTTGDRTRALAGVALVAACGRTESSALLDDGSSGGGTLDLGAPAGRCDDHNPSRNLYFGDLHVHTAASFDAWLHDTRVDADAAYRFAQGEPVLLPPLSDRGVGTRRVQLSRPLDFAAVTDHAEFLAEVAACVEPGNPAYDSTVCAEFRANDNAALLQFAALLANADPERIPEICGDSGIDCQAEARRIWQRMIDTAQANQDPTPACRFTTFIAYEWTGVEQLSNLHRNVIFASDVVPDAPITHFEAPTAWQLWQGLRAQCIDGLPGCDVLAIPHNANLSNGRMFQRAYPPDRSQAEAAAERVAIEPLVEMYQHKGAGECTRHVGGILGETDEQCDFEAIRPPPYEDCGDEVGSGGMIGSGCVSRLDFVRGVLLAGMQEQQRIGVNPYRLGIIASTDTHNGTPGLVDEAAYAGHIGSEEADALMRLTAPTADADPRNSPGGLVAVWAEENSREAIFAALRRREVYATSGTRIAVRLFGGAIAADACDRGDLVELADATGVPMGAKLRATEAPAPPSFVVLAQRDAGTPDAPGAGLQRVQIVKGWLDDAGVPHVAVHDVAGSDAGDSIDPATCQPPASGADTLCGTWTDATYDPREPTFWYARVLEVPTCRWSMRDCNALGDAAPEVCRDGSLPSAIQERAWTSPIWSR